MENNKMEKFAYSLMHLTLIVFSLSVVIPFILTFTVSISDERSLVNNGYRFIPDVYSLEAYKMIFSNEIVIRAYCTSIIVTLVGTALSVILCSMAGYAMSVKKVKYRNRLSMYFYIPMIFNAGLVPWYLVVVKTLRLKNSLFALILPILIVPYNVFLLRNYFKALPPDIAEAAEIDGLTPMGILIKIVFPLSTPIIATISLFIALMYWNDWVLALWLIDKKELYPLQFMLYRIQSLIAFMRTQEAQSIGGDNLIPTQTVQMATMFVTIGPIILVYPFVQKYFVKGIMIGAIKG